MNIDQHQDNRIDEREWLAQERARLEARGAAPEAGDPMVARYRALSHALRTPMADGLPADFAARVAMLAQGEHGVPVEADAPFERDLTHVLIGVFGLSAAAVATMYGKQWLPPIMELLHLDSASAVNWALALGACVGVTWLTGQLRRHEGTTRAA
jgi:hypothetical protein